MVAEERNRVVAGGFFMLPIVALAIVNLVMRPPRSNEAAPAEPMLPIVAARAAAASLDAKTKAAVDRVLALETLEFGAMPLSAGKGVEIVTTDVGPVLPAIPQFTVGAIIASSRGNIANIDGTMYRVGDSFTETWIVKEIDAVTRSVTIEDAATARSVTVTVDGPL
jgi:hypothetical protein